MKLHELHAPEGATHRKKVVGRGIGGKGGKTAGRGTKGQKARRQIPAQFEGGQLPLIQRIPKLKGFTNPFRVEYTAVNLDVLSRLDTSELTREAIVAAGLAGKSELIKVLGRGSVDRALHVSAHAVSASARAAIEAAGGSVSILAKPFAVRPPAAGNQHQNR